MKKNINRILALNSFSTILLWGISFFSAPIFSRLLGTEGYGVLSVFNTWTGILVAVFSLQTAVTLVNAKVDFPESEQPRYQSSVLSLTVVSFLVLGCAAAVLIRPISRWLRMQWYLIAMMLIQAWGTSCTNFLNTKFNIEFKAGKNLLLSVATALSFFGLSLVLVLRLPREVNYMGRILGNVIISGGLGVFICFHIFRRGRCFYDKKYWKYCLALSVPMICSNISDLILGHSDLVMLSQMAGDTPSGIYAYAYNFGAIMFMIFGALNNSWVPFFFEDMKAGNRENVRRQFRNFMELFTVLSVGFVLLATEVFHVYADGDFWPGTNLIPIFVGGYFLNFLCTFPVNFEYYYKKTPAVAAITIASAVLNLALNFFLIQRLGMLGAALASMLSHVLQFAAHSLYVVFGMKQWEYPFPIWQWIPHTALFCGAVALVYLTPEGGILRWVLGAAIGIWELLRIKKRRTLI